jgi:hypothetical protein
MPQDEGEFSWTGTTLKGVAPENPRPECGPFKARGCTDFPGRCPISVYLIFVCFTCFDMLWPMQRATALRELDDWEIICSFLPEGWQEKARSCGALTRARGISGAEALLRPLLIHVATGCSLAETAVRARQMGLGELNASAVYKRLRSAEEWLRWMAEQMRARLGMITPPGSQRVRAVK